MRFFAPHTKGRFSFFTRLISTEEDFIRLISTEEDNKLNTAKLRYEPRAAEQKFGLAYYLIARIGYSRVKN